ncbi:GMP synthase [Lentibacillus populi]|uniref:GMP synthase n=1 Tax=Lentibacillus populi TaxID=1827502 RepID=A0A9W5X5K4_9BACI|nr:type 1 glutamine amidotransferase [Lentibacillus populi]MBT2214543.1 type 1 glutamine amidotransferase [Virgibacillus dakarensis]GGB40985.1 GMP synthase [Lentibacillus populi]
MNISIIQHVEFEKPGLILDWAKSYGHSVKIHKVFENSDMPNHNETDLLIILGGPMSVYDNEKYIWLESERELIREFKNLKKPVLGICLGAQQIAKAFDGDVVNNHIKEAGFFNISRYEQNKINFFPDEIKVFHWHQEELIPPTTSQLLFRSKGCLNQGFIYDGNIIGLQFHLETTKDNILEII